MNILVTGASKGLGNELVKAFVRKGNHTVIALSRNKLLLSKLIKDCKKINPEASVVALTADIVNLVDDPSEMLARISSLCNHIDILVNNAGSLINKPFVDIEITEAKSMFDVNFFAPAFLIKNLLHLMGRKAHTHIVNISSMGGFQGSSKYPGLSYYSSGKAAIAVFTECLAGELKDRNISVNCLALGAVQTEMLNEAFPGYKANLTAAEMAEYIAEFCLKGHKYFNGRIIPVTVSNP